MRIIGKPFEGYKILKGSKVVASGFSTRIQAQNWVDNRRATMKHQRKQTPKNRVFKSLFLNT